MAKKKGNLYGKIISYEPTFHKTSIGRNPSKAKMNKHKRRMFKKYRGQGKWTRDQTSIQMERWLILDYRKILDHQKVEVVVGIVVNIAIVDHFVIFIKHFVSKIFMFAINGDQDILKGIIESHLHCVVP